jgi:hypothetical protein
MRTPIVEVGKSQVFIIPLYILHNGKYKPLSTVFLRENAQDAHAITKAHHSSSNSERKIRIQEGASMPSLAWPP